MATLRRTAMGEGLDMDLLRLSNENTIAIGNMKVNARGDQLGPGGKVIKTRAQVMQEYHKIHTPLADDELPVSVSSETTQAPSTVAQPVAEDIPVAESAAVPNYTKPRGSFADAVAKETEVTQELVEPKPLNKPGIQRI